MGVRGRLTFISGSEVCIFTDPEASESWECLKIRAQPVDEAEGEGQVGGWVGTRPFGALQPRGVGFNGKRMESH